MEIGGGAVAVFQHGDVHVFVRCKADAIDRLAFEALKNTALRAVLAGEPVALSRSLTAVFVCGWSGVTRDGEQMPYSWQLLESVLPPHALQELHKFVTRSVDILKE